MAESKKRGSAVERLVSIFGRDNVYVELQRHFLREEEARNQAAVEIARALHLPIARDQRRALCAGRAARDPRRLHRHPPSPHARNGRPPAGAQLRAPPEIAAGDGAPVCRSAGSHRQDGPALVAIAVHAGRSRLRISALSGARGRNHDLLPAEARRGRRTRALRPRTAPHTPTRKAADRARAGADREARSRRLFPHRLGHRALLPRAGHPGAGTRLGGQLRRLLLAGHHRRRSDRDGPAVRALPLGRARRVAGHRSRSAFAATSASAPSSTSISATATRRGHDRQRHHLSRALGGARDRQGAGLRSRDARPALQASSARGNTAIRDERWSASSAMPASTSPIRACANSSSSRSRCRTCRAISASTPAAW